MKLIADTQKIIEQFIQTRVNDAGAKGVVLGLSGGIDSAVTLSLAVSALGSENVFGLIMPFNKSESIALALDHAKKLGVKTIEYNISEIVSSFKEVSNTYSTKAAEGNLHSRIRMSLLYGKAFSSNYLVIGTSNKSELLIGYYTKWGDGASDFLPIGDLYKSQVYELSKDLEVPLKIINRPPTAELWEGQTDESELGIDYLTLDQILLGLERQIPKKDLSLKRSIGLDLIIKIDNLIKSSIHKRVFPPVCKIGRRTVGLDWRETIGSK
ncbi:MAG: NAD+ synthase [Candidatus Poseidoniia archaeon]|mgnify:FL=1|nr:NAD+ synthase [Candidatus Poseidoniia archaeon]